MKHKMLPMLLATVMLGNTQHLFAAEFVLKFSHFWPATSDINTQVFEAWANAIEADSNGRIKIDMFPSQTLTKAAASYKAVVDGVADISATAQGYTANRFPLTQVVELPGVTKSSAQGSCVVQTLFDENLISTEYQDTHVLYLFTHGPGHIHSRNKLIETPEDFKGMKVRRPTAVVGELLKELGAQPIGMPAPHAFQSLQRGVIDAAAMPWEGAHVFRLNELTKFHTEITGGLYNLAFVMTMNKAVYEKLPADLKLVIDKNSGLDWAERAAAIFDSLDKVAKQKAEEANHTTIVIKDGIEDPVWKPILRKASENYLSSVEKNQKAVRSVYKRALELSDSCL